MLEEMTAGLRRQRLAVLALVASMVCLPGGAAPLANLDAQSLASFRDRFNAAADEIRIILLLSPT